MINKELIESTYKKITTNYMVKQNNRDEAFLQDLVDTIISIEAICSEYINTDSEVHPNYVLEKIEQAKARWDSAQIYFEKKAKELNNEKS